MIFHLFNFTVNSLIGNIGIHFLSNFPLKNFKIIQFQKKSYCVIMSIIYNLSPKELHLKLLIYLHNTK